jgi:hypothetical protein
MTSRVYNSPKSQTSGAPKPEGLNSLRLSIGFLGIGHMDPSKLSRVKHESLNHKVVKDLGIISQLHNEESEEDILFEDGRAKLTQCFLSQLSYRFTSHDTSRAKLGHIDDQSEA